MRLEKMTEVEAKRSFDARKKTVPHETGKLFPAGRKRPRQALEKGEFASVGLAQMNQAKVAETFDLNGSWRSFEQLVADARQRFVSLEPVQQIVVLLRGEEPMDELGFKKTVEKPAYEDCRIDRWAQDQRFA
jgi:hypothetical protein